MFAFLLMSLAILGIHPDSQRVFLTSWPVEFRVLSLVLINGHAFPLSVSLHARSCVLVTHTPRGHCWRNKYIELLLQPLYATANLFYFKVSGR